MTAPANLTLICALDDVEEDEPFLAELDDVAYAIFQVEDEYFVTEDSCSHGPGSLSEGFVEDCQIECPFHQGKFDLRTGLPAGPPCEVPIKVWTPVVQGGSIYIDISAPKRSQTTGDFKLVACR